MKEIGDFVHPYFRFGYTGGPGNAISPDSVFRGHVMAKPDMRIFPVSAKFPPLADTAFHTRVGA